MGQLKIHSHTSEQFHDRTQAGKMLAEKLKKFAHTDSVVLAVPRGGIITGVPIAEQLAVPLDVVLTHKLGAPANPELAIGAVSESGQTFVHTSLLSYVGADDDYIEREKQRQLETIQHRSLEYRKLIPPIPLQGKTAIVTDDGVATGATMQAALWSIRQQNPASIILALPVGPADTLEKLAKDADKTIALRCPNYFGALGSFYARFDQVTDEEMTQILELESKRRTTGETQ